MDWTSEVYAGERGTISAVLHGLLAAAALVLGFAANRHFGFALVAVVVVKLLVLFGYDFRQPRRERVYDARGMAELNATVAWYFVAHVLGLAALGIFAAIQSLLLVAGAVARRLPGAALILAIAAPWICGALFGPVYGKEPRLVAALTAAAGITLMEAILSEMLPASPQLPFEILSIAGVSLACVWLVPKFGLLGAACAVGYGAAIRVGGDICLLRSQARRPRGAALLALLKTPLV